MNPYETFVRELSRVVRQGKDYPLGGFAAPKRLQPAADAPRALIFSPHPDDEVIIGAFPLRLLRELGWSVINVAVTQGSNKARQRERWKELQACCDYIGFGLLATVENGLDGINSKARLEDPRAWSKSVECIARILSAQRPKVIFFPHDDDWNVTHIGTHYLVVDALREMGSGFSCHTVETEFWGAMNAPNLLVESSERDVIDLITALSFHIGEVKRNPYHLRLPAWLMDNVRRGSELVGGQGGVAPDFLFGTLYRLRRWQRGTFEPVLKQGRFIAQSEEVRALFAP